MKITHIALGKWYAVCGEDFTDDSGAITVTVVVEAMVSDDFDGSDSLPDDLCPNCLRRVHRAMERLRREKGWIK